MDEKLIVALPLVALIVVAAIGIACERYIRRHPRNRRVRRSAWTNRHAHPSFWNNDRRGHTECR